MSPLQVAAHLEQKARQLRVEADHLDTVPATTQTLSRRNHAAANQLRAEAQGLTAQAWTLRARTQTNHHARP
ncbi:hypothetical protein GCM10023081_47060 [Arthrobacter ginkgonis]|uniref:Uncharacterized protein n=1 Tax=Arthrobacter ginkgonis TaxID=1630594 RepID=A0ABP7DMI5_9MICC